MGNAYLGELALNKRSTGRDQANPYLNLDSDLKNHLINSIVPGPVYSFIVDTCSLKYQPFNMSIFTSICDQFLFFFFERNVLHNGTERNLMSLE